MSKRSVGVSLISIAAFLYGIRYVAAAIFGSGVSSWSSELFRSMLNYVGNGPVIASWIALIAGVGYLLSAEFGRKPEALLGQKFGENIEQIKENWKQ